MTYMNLLQQMGHLNTPRIFYTLNATKNGKERLFKKLKNRSRRAYKKLLKRNGGFEFRQEPAIITNGQDYLVHPALRPEIERLLNQEKK